ncbi:TIM23 complex component [Thecaphora frezii]
MLATPLRQQLLSAARRTAAGPSFASTAAAAASSRSAYSSSSSSSASSSSSSSSPSSSSSAAPSASRSTSSAPASRPLTWDAYLRLRRSRRLAGLVTTIPTTLLAGSAAGSYFLTLEFDPTNAVAGIDPMFIYAGLTLACTGLGWLTGPTVGASVWSLLHRKQAKEIAQKDHDFYEHIKRRRVDPTRQTMQNPVPDYYGEKIGSIKQYRQWLRDQAAYRRKAAHGLEEDA